MKARFLFILKRMQCDIDNAWLAIHACCVLNSVCEHLGDAVLPQWYANVGPSNVAYEQPARSTDAVEGSEAK